MIKKYRKKPVVIEAIQFTSTYKEIGEWMDNPVVPTLETNAAHLVGIAPPIYSIPIKTLEGEMRATTGDYIIKGVNGEFYPCKPDIFAKTYEEVTS